MQPEQQDKHMISLLGNMEQGFHIFSKDGDLYVQRMCKWVSSVQEVKCCEVFLLAS